MPRTATEIASFQDRPTLNPSPHQADSMPSIPSQDKMSASVQSKLADMKAEDKESPASVNRSSARKRRREEPIPVYAQSSRSGPSNNPFLLGKRPVKATPPVKREQSMGNDPLRQTPAQASRPDMNGHTIPNNDVQIPTAHPPVPRGGLLGPWEPSILNHIPYEEVTKFVSDFLFNEVVLRHDVGVASNKGVHSQAAVLEIEAKIGQLKDTAYGTRLHLPVMSECVFCVTDPKYKTKFESSMTETQHRELNRFLNQALVNSKPQNAKTASNLAHRRVQMDYAHTYETDTFYPLSQAGILTLPKSIRTQINPRDRLGQSVRVTTNNKTGQLIAQIIKVRVANLEIYSPGTLFDWRISVNVEMKIEGDFRQLIEPGDYQIDLTQVTEADASKKHELEVEVASQEIRTQGQLALDGQPNQYEELVKGFVDNVRILCCQREASEVHEETKGTDPTAWYTTAAPAI
ncbi:hypothetical protein G7Y79_00018g044380 [Physcia stellaris]|nr:hypothetical protein G7Y79_00018g044380 [Physcia stellaris]